MRERASGLSRLLLLASLGIAFTPSVVPAGLAKATFAGGCFWCMQPPFDALEGVVSTTVGYTGGRAKNPTYEEVSAGGTGHAESVQIVYDPAKIGYERLLDVFWHNVDPLTQNAQFCDHGRQYRTAIFYQDESQHRLAEESKRRLEESKRFDRPIVTEIVPATVFYPAGRVPSALSREESDPLRVLPLELRSRPPPERALGRRLTVGLMARS